MDNPEIPVVMTIAGNDPTGGAGITADIETIISQGSHAIPVVTCITVQDTCDVIGITPIDSQLVIQQARAILEDIPIDVIKIGLLGNEEIIEAVHEIIIDYPTIPIVFDPILTSAGRGNALVTNDMLDAMQELIIPMTYILTPNSHEVLELVPEADSISAAAIALNAHGCEYVLVTGTHENTPQVVNRLYNNQQELCSYTWDRLDNSYHGSGCTLSSAIASLLAQGLEIQDAIHEAQEFTWNSLKYGYRLGMGQHHPNRMFWASTIEEDDNAVA